MTDAAPGSLMVFERELEISLLDGEKVLFAGRPQAGRLQLYLLLSAIMVSLLTVVGVLFLPLSWWVARAYTQKHRYWLTTSRVVVTTGIIGYRARSIPLERVSDVAISCNWLERLLGLRSVMVRDMTGEAQTGAAMLAVEDATAVQRQILDRVQQANQRSVAPGGRYGQPYRELEAAGEQGRMLSLLEKIEQNTRRE